MEKYVLDTREISLNPGDANFGAEKRVILAFNLLNPEGSDVRKEGKAEDEKATSLREGFEKIKNEVKNMGTAEFSFWIVNTLLLFLIVLKEFFLI